MTDANADLVLDVLASQEAEYPPFHAAAHQLSHWMTAASGTGYKTQMKLRSAIALNTPGGEPNIIIVSLLGAVGARKAAFSDIAARWRQQISALIAGTHRPVFLCTIFRHVPQMQDRQLQAWTVERIRRLNLLTMELSQSTGASVIDIDRVLAHIGARTLQTDYSLTGRIGAGVAGDVIVSALLAGGLDDFVDAQTLQKAQQLHGGLRGLSQRLQRNLAQA